MIFNEKTIFCYANTPAGECCYGVDDGGFSVELYDDGTFVYKTYIFDVLENTKREYVISTVVVDRIKRKLKEVSLDLENIPDFIDNGSRDGDCSSFKFLERIITDFNIEYTDKDDIKVENPKYYEEYKEVIEQENKIIDIFLMVSECLESANIELSLESVKIGEQNFLQ